MPGFLGLLAGSPLTGDDRNVALYVILGAVCAALILLFVFLGRKNKK